MAYKRQASHDLLRLRATVLARIREFFAARAVLEVETPALSPVAVSDPAIESVAAELRCLEPARHYLHTSPEFAMKRLLADGMGDIFQLCRVFRDGELGRWHQPEFTLLEWYRVGWNEHELMAEVAALINEVLSLTGTPRSVKRLRYAQAFEQVLEIDPHGDRARLEAALRARGVDVPAALDHDGLLDLALGTAVVPALAAEALTFIHGYPASQAALAESDPGPPPVAARFEVFAAGIELGNGFRELTDACEQRRRFGQDLARRGAPDAPLDEDFLEALGRLPACSGVALGVDRLIALAADRDALAATLSFAHER